MTSSQTLKTDKALFDLSNCELGYAGDPVLQPINLKIIAGEKVALIGKSGAGKSTLLRHLQQCQPEISAYCPQHHSLVPILSVFHNIYMGQLDKHSIFYNLLNLISPFKKELDAVRDITANLEIESKLLTSIDKLSGGQQQRVNIGRALFQKRSVFIGDEPVSATDWYHGKRILTEICRQHETVILALHDINLALSSCDRIVGIKDHQIVLDAASSTLEVDDLQALYH